jgi:hypothetical protein
MDITRDYLLGLGIVPDTADQLLTRLADAAKRFIPKGRFDEVLRERDEHKRLLADANSQIADLSKVDSDKLLGEIAALKERLKTSEAESATKLQEARTEAAVKLYLAGKTHDMDIVWGLLDKDKLKITDSGEVEGLDKLVEGLQESKPFLFVHDDGASKRVFRPVGNKPPEGVPTPAGGTAGGSSLGARLAKIRSTQNEVVENSDKTYFKKG